MNVTLARPRASSGTISRFSDYALYLAAIVLYCLPFIGARNLFYRDETRYASVLRELIEHNAWFALTIDGQPYLDKPPLFFTLLRLAAELTGSIEPWVFYSVIGLTAFIFLIGSDAFLRTAGFDRATTRLVNLFVLAIPWLAFHMQAVRMDFLFSGLILLSMAAFARGIERGEANYWSIAGGFFAGVAVLVKGPFGAVMPFFSVVAFLLVSGRPRRLLRADLLISLFVAILLVATWLLFLNATFGWQSIRVLFGEQVIERAVLSRDTHYPWWLYLEWVPLMLMPWLLLAPLLARRTYRVVVLTGEPGAAIPPQGVRLVLAYLAVSLILLTPVAQKSVRYLLPLLPALMLPVAVAYRRLEAHYPRVLDWLYVALAASLLSVIVGTGAAIELLPADLKADLQRIVGEASFNRALAAVSLAVLPLAVAALLRGRNRVIANIVSMAIVIAALKATLATDFNRAFSPQAVAAAFEIHVPNGVPIVVYNMPRGSLSYDFRHRLQYVDEREALGRALGETGAAYVVARERQWASEPGLFAGFETLARGRIEATDLMLLGRPSGD
ncbi:MAG: hypothetical protein WD036_09065 [Bauldia sp.]